uniref:PPPDE domain-containing protein n=1 Tax=Amphimedon queenslandica TaxID=400682 RepID=A0A1X7UMW7_AMPQE
MSTRHLASKFSDFYARPFTGVSGSLKIYIESMWNEEYSSSFPGCYEAKEWDVYILFKSLFDHYSMMFLLPGYVEGFLVHLMVNEENNKTEFYCDYVKLCKFKAEKYKGLKALSLGTTMPLTAAHIITKAHEILASMGAYHAVLNNCQDYCKKIASGIGVSSRFANWKNLIFADAFDGTSSPSFTDSVSDIVSSASSLSLVGPRRGTSLVMAASKLSAMYEELKKALMPRMQTLGIED